MVRADLGRSSRVRRRHGIGAHAADRWSAPGDRTRVTRQAGRLDDQRRPLDLTPRRRTPRYQTASSSNRLAAPGRRRRRAVALRGFGANVARLRSSGVIRWPAVGGGVQVYFNVRSAAHAVRHGDPLAARAAARR